MPMRNPPHPGEVVRWECLEPLGLTVTRAAKGLGVTRQALSDLVNGKAGVSVEMSLRLSQAFGSTPETWLGMQTPTTSGGPGSAGRNSRSSGSAHRRRPSRQPRGMPRPRCAMMLRWTSLAPMETGLRIVSRWP